MMGMPHRFWDKVRKGDGCWLWTAYRDKDGYGMFWWNGRNCMAHRISYQIASGVDPGEQCVCHHCDNPSCVNPQHLFLGTATENNEDRDKKGRQCRGVYHARQAAKLSEAQVIEIRRKASSGEYTTTQLAADYGVSRPAVSLLVRGVYWPHLPGSIPNYYETIGRKHLEGNTNARRKLTESDVVKVRSMRSEGKTFKAIAAHFLVSAQAVHNVVTGKTWSHVA